MKSISSHLNLIFENSILHIFPIVIMIIRRNAQGFSRVFQVPGFITLPHITTKKYAIPTHIITNDKVWPYTS